MQTKSSKKREKYIARGSAAKVETKRVRQVLSLVIKCHTTTKKCHNVTQKCHAMTSCTYENNHKTQDRSVGYVKVRFFALPLM